MKSIYEKITKYIDEHISEEITIDDLSRTVGHSPARFSRAWTGADYLAGQASLQQQRFHRRRAQAEDGRGSYASG